ncbi:hypothetical protein GQ55_2G135800 [Panicum hallii var. hallii]|uniref:Uncharacterized protein n=1 Tax=Panicum hallii var. hallii TaxID=1504633 RepID=A0A2T7EPI4_9POAL|nr:hypothetical protein GQ55_2G135800 [Panicum hallii var. hallii]
MFIVLLGLRLAVVSSESAAVQKIILTFYAACCSLVGTMEKILCIFSLLESNSLPRTQTGHIR